MRVNLAKSLLCPEKDNPELRIRHTPFPANLFFFFAFKIQTPQNPAVSVCQFRQPLIDRLPHLKDFRIRTDPRILYGNFRIRQRFPSHPAPVFQNDVPAHAIHKGAEFIRIVTNLTLLPGAHETRKRLLHDVVHIRAIVPHVVENFVSELQSQPFK